jgi:DNA-binding CsgD family transcriptional regulator
MAGTVAMPVPLLEREGELRRIEQGLAAACAGRGCLILVEGPAGIGKTALVGSARSASEAAGMRVLRARGAELEHDFAFGIVRQLFEPALAETPELERSELLQGPAGLAGRLLGLPGAVAEHDALPESPDPSFAVLHGLYWLCANLAADRPLCLVVDDAHWADTPSLRYLAFLLPRLEELKVAVLLAARRGEPGAATALIDALAGDASTRLVDPSPLSPSAVTQLVEAGLGATPDPAFVAACHRATGGTPFLVHQLVAALHEDGVEPTAAAATGVELLGARGLGRWIVARLDRLAPTAARLARAVAMLEAGELDHAAALAGLDRAEAAAAADTLEAAGILAPGRPLAFIHPIVRTGIYEELGSAERARSHREAARLLAESHAPEEQIVEHLLASDPTGEAWIVERLVSVARAAARSGAPETAAVYLARALAEPPAPEQRSKLLLELGVAEDNAGLSDAYGHLEAAMAAAGDPHDRTAAALVLAHALARDNRFVEALEVLDRAQPDDRGGGVEALAVSVAMFSPATAQVHTRRIRMARERAESEESPTQEQLAVAGLIAVRSNEPAVVAARLALRTLAAGPRTFPGPTDLPWFQQAAITLLWAERYEELHAVLDDAVARARATGDAALFSGALAYRGWLALRRGDLSAAEADSRTALEAASLPAPGMYRARNVAVLVETLVERGDLDEAERILEPLAAAMERDTTIAAQLRLSRGRLRVAQRQPADGLADFRAAGDTARRAGFVCPSCLPWRSEAALALVALGSREEAVPLAEEELALAREFGASRALGAALTAAGLVAEGTRAESLLAEAVSTLEAGEAQLELARARLELGSLLRRANRRADARPLLREALDFAFHTGASPLAGRAEIELRATGAKPRRLLLTGLEALTASERRVAELAAQGLTNREIAQALFVTARTVEGHLTHVFQKLQLNSREQLPAVLAT